jgi:flavin reductase (DIM6/NTAB) family NADH-FMN oxidoreductase RutF
MVEFSQIGIKMSTNKFTVEYRKTMSNFATGVTVVTTFDEKKIIHGMTANSFTSVSLNPPTVLVCIGHTRNTFTHVKNTNQFAINILSSKQKKVADYFAKEQTKGDEIIEFNWSIKFGSPFIEGSIAFIKANVVELYNYGDHAIILGEVEGFDTKNGAPLLYYQSDYLSVPDSS